MEYWSGKGAWIQERDARRKGQNFDALMLGRDPVRSKSRLGSQNQDAEENLITLLEMPPTDPSKMTWPLAKYRNTLLVPTGSPVRPRLE
jgi:hypothetical protein